MSYSNHEIRKAVAAFTLGGKGVVRMYESLLTDYWERDSHSPVRVGYMLSVMHKTAPRLAKQAAKCLCLHLPVDVDFKGEIYNVTNRAGTSKQAKVVFKRVLSEFISANETSLFNVTKKKDKVAKIFNKAKKLDAVAKAMAELLANDVSVAEIQTLLAKADATKVIAVKKAA
jgi:hypothetical protein